jgi:hypothetical protein
MEAQEFAVLPYWVDQAPEEARAEIRRLREASRPPDTRLIPADQGLMIAEQHDAGRRRFLACTEPFCHVRVNDCEIGLLGAGYLPSSRLKDLEWHFKIAGYARGALKLRSTFIEAIREAELVGLQDQWTAVKEDTAALLAMLGMPLPRPNAVEIHLIYKLLVDGTLFNWLAGKTVLLVGGLASRLYIAWHRPVFQRAYGMFGPVEKIRVRRAVDVRSRKAGGAWAEYDRILEETKKGDYDVALLSCGVIAKPLAWEIRQSGRTALDVGFVFDALFADEVDVVERSQRPVFKDITWPGREW